MSDAWVAGAAMTVFGRSDMGPAGLAAEAAMAALADAGVAAEEVGQVFVGNAAAGLLLGQEMIRGQVFLADTPLAGKPLVNVENACASSSTAFGLAVTAVRAGMVDVAVALGVEKMAVPVKSRIFGALAAATDTVRRADMRAYVEAAALGDRPEGWAPPTSSPFMDHYGNKGALYLEKFGATVEDFARIVVKSRAFAAENPKAQFGKPTTVEEVLAGRRISGPLTLAMCAPIGDGAAALVVVSDRVAARLGSSVRVLATSLTSGEPSNPVVPVTRAARAAYEAAGVGPADVSVVEVHDAAAPAEFFCLEDLEMCREGEAVELLRAGVTGPGGSRPVNTSGGLLSRGHPIGATGCGQLVELADQLRGRSGPRQVPGARIGLAQNAGGVLGENEGAAVVTILERVGS
jgi:acetyl-CoA acetyltransferase